MAVATTLDQGLMRSFGLASLIVIVGVASSWVYLKLGVEEQLMVLPEIAAIEEVAPKEAAEAAAEAWVHRGDGAYAAGQIVDPATDNALYYYQRALTENSEDAAARIGIQRVVAYLEKTADAAIFRKDWEVARRNAERIIAVSPRHIEGLQILERVGTKEQLAKLAQAAIQQVSKGRYTKPKDHNALASFRQMLELDPGNVEATQGIEAIAQRFLGFAQTAAFAQDQDKAKAFIETAKSIDPDAPGLSEAEVLTEQWSQMALGQTIQDELSAAASALESGRLTGPRQPNALELFDSVLAKDPQSEAALRGKVLVAQALIDRARSHTAAGDLEAAQASIASAEAAGARAGSLGEVRSELKYQRALARARAGEFDKFYRIGELKTRRESVPGYPRRMSGDGWVELRFTVSETGRVIDADVTDSSDSRFDRAALRAIGRWRFEPYLVDGRPMPVRTGIRFAFQGSE